MRGDAVIPALAVQIDFGDALAHQELQHDQRREHGGIGQGQKPVDFHAENDGIEDQRQQDLELAFDLVHQPIDGMECLAGEERLDLLARMAVAQQGREVAIVAREPVDIETEGPHAGALGIDPAHRAGGIGRALNDQDPDQVVHQAVAAIGHVAPGLDYQPGCGGRQQRFEYQQYEGDVERPAQEEADKLEAGEGLATHVWRAR